MTPQAHSESAPFLVANELAGLAEALGLDSFLGSLHQLDYGRRSLALDLVELFRAPFGVDGPSRRIMRSKVKIGFKGLRYTWRAAMLGLNPC